MASSQLPGICSYCQFLWHTLNMKSCIPFPSYFITTAWIFPNRMNISYTLGCLLLYRFLFELCRLLFDKLTLKLLVFWYITTEEFYEIFSSSFSLFFRFHRTNPVFFIVLMLVLNLWFFLIILKKFLELWTAFLYFL